MLLEGPEVLKAAGNLTIKGIHKAVARNRRTGSTGRCDYQPRTACEVCGDDLPAAIG